MLPSLAAFFNSSFFYFFAFFFAFRSYCSLKLRNAFPSKTKNLPLSLTFLSLI